MIFLLLTNNESINNALIKVAHVVWVKDAKKAVNLVSDEDFDGFLIAEPFNKNTALLKEIDKRQIDYVLIEKVDDLIQYIRGKKAGKESVSLPAEDKTYSAESILLVTTNQETIKVLKGFNISIATTPYSADRHINDNDYRAILWDLPAEPVNAQTLLYVWGRDIKTPDELDFVLKNGHLRITEPAPEPPPRLIANDSEPVIAQPKPEIDTSTIKAELENIQQFKLASRQEEPTKTGFTEILRNIFKNIPLKKQPKTEKEKKEAWPQTGKKKEWKKEQIKETAISKPVEKRNNTSIAVATLGNIPDTPFLSKGYQLVADYKDADYIISNIKTLSTLPEGIIPREIQLCVLGTGKPSDLKARDAYPRALLFNNIEGIITYIEDIKYNRAEVKPNKLTVLPGTRAANNNLSLQKGGAVFIVCPSRPAMASELAGRLSASIENTALICAAAESTAAINLGVDANSLIENDWRFPGSIAPIHHKGVCVWPVDPYKHSNPITPYDVHRLVEQVKHKFILVIVDCSGSLSYCSRIAHDEAIIVLRKEKDTSDLTTTQWLSNYKGKNVLEILPSETLAVTEAENGILIGTQVNTNTGREIL